IKAASHLIIFYPVYYCELNFIEYFSGRAKLYAQANFPHWFEWYQRHLKVSQKS
ncbi:hypothetical protein L873DRAFT_1673563, partial [Choiromyces venosus 120613-1]